MKKLVLLASLLSSNAIFADVLHNFAQIQSAVINGQTIHIAVNFAKCSTNRAMDQLSVGVFTPDTIQVQNNFLSTSLTHFTLNNPTFYGKPVYEFVTYTVSDDNNLKLTSQVLDANNYAPLSPKMAFLCQVDVAARFYN